MLSRDLIVHWVIGGGGLASAIAAFANGYYNWVGLFGIALLALALANLCWWKRPVFPYDCILSASSTDGLHWVRDEGLRIDVGGGHNSNQVYYPDIITTAGGFRIYYRGGGDKSVILSGVSADGMVWRVEQGERLGLGQQFERLGGSDIIPLATGYRIYFAGYDGTRWKIYCSESRDGLVWGRETCCLEVGEGRGLPHIKDPSIVAVADLYRMYFMRFSDSETHIYVSTSADGIAWSTMERCLGYEGEESRFVRNPNVVALDSGGWRMYFAEASHASALGSRIASAVSRDGLQWSREEGHRLVPGGTFDGQGVFCPDVVRVHDGWKMYYGGYWKKHLLAPYTLFCHRPR